MVQHIDWDKKVVKHNLTKLVRCNDNMAGRPEKFHAEYIFLPTSALGN